MPSPFDDLRRRPEEALDAPGRQFGSSFFEQPSHSANPGDIIGDRWSSHGEVNQAIDESRAPYSTYAHEAEVEDLKADTKQRRLNRYKASDLADRGIPAYTNEHGDVTPVTDETGHALNAYDPTHSVAYDTKGEAVHISYGETGGPILKDAFADLPMRTDPKTGDIEQKGRGLYRYVGQDPVIAAAAKQKEKDQEISKTASLLGRRLTLDEHDLTVGTKEHKDLTEDLQQQVPTLIDKKYEGADKKTVLGAIDEQFNAEYATPEANATGWFSSDLTPEAKALRADIDSRKAKAIGTAENLYGLKDNLNQLTETVGAYREEERAHVDTLLAHQLGEKGPLDEQPEGAVGGGTPAPGLYPPERDWGRMLGGAKVDGDSGKIPEGKQTPAEDIDPATGHVDVDTAIAQAKAGNKNYGVSENDQGVFATYKPGQFYAGLYAATKDGLVSPKWAEEHRAEFKKVDDAYFALHEAAGDEQTVKALIHGMSVGGAFLAGAGPGARAGALAGAAIPGLGETAIPSIVGSILGGLTTGTIAAFAARKGMEKLAEYSDAMKSLTASAELNPITSSVGELIAFGASAPKSISNLVGLGRAAALGVSDLGAVAQTKAAAKAVGAQMGISNLTAVGFETVIRPAFDLARYAAADAVGIKHDEFQSPTAKSVLTMMGIGSVLAGHSVRLRHVPTAELDSIMFRGHVRTMAGMDLKAESPAEFIKAAEKLGLKIDIKHADAMSKPLSPQEEALWNSIKVKAERMAKSGLFTDATGVQFKEGVIAEVPTLGKEGKVIAAGAVEVKRGPAKGGLPEGPTTPEPPKGPEPTKPTPETPTGKGGKPVGPTKPTPPDIIVPPTTTSGVGTAKPPPKVTPVPSPEIEGTGRTPTTPTAPEPPKEKTPQLPPDLRTIESEEQRFVADAFGDRSLALDALRKMRRDFPDPKARMEEIGKRLAGGKPSEPPAKTPEEVAAAEAEAEGPHTIESAEQRYVAEGHPDRETGLRQLRKLRKDYPDPAQRMVQIEKHLAAMPPKEEAAPTTTPEAPTAPETPTAPPTTPTGKTPTTRPPAPGPAPTGPAKAKVAHKTREEMTAEFEEFGGAPMHSVRLHELQAKLPKDHPIQQFRPALLVNGKPERAIDGKEDHAAIGRRLLLANPNPGPERDAINEAIIDDDLHVFAPPTKTEAEKLGAELFGEEPAAPTTESGGTGSKPVEPPAPETTTTEPKKTKLDTRAGELEKRKAAIKGLSATDEAVINTLLAERTAKSLDKAEEMIAKREAAGVTSPPDEQPTSTPKGEEPKGPDTGAPPDTDHGPAPAPQDPLAPKGSLDEPTAQAAVNDWHKSVEKPLAALGTKFGKGVTNASGFEYHIPTNEIRIDLPLFLLDSRLLSGNDQLAVLNARLHEEYAHAIDVQATPGDFDKTHLMLWGALTSDEKNALKIVLMRNPAVQNDNQPAMAAEYIARLYMDRHGLAIPESVWMDVSPLLKQLRGPQSKHIEDHLVLMEEAIEPGEAEDEDNAPFLVTGKHEGISIEQLVDAVYQAVTEGAMVEGLKETDVDGGRDLTGHYVIIPRDADSQAAGLDAITAIGPFVDEEAAKRFLDSEVGAPGATVVNIQRRPEVEALMTPAPEPPKGESTAEALGNELFGGETPTEGAPDATTTGEQPGGPKPELPRVPPRTDIPTDETEVREGESGQAGGGGGAVQRPETPEGEPGVQQPEKAPKVKKPKLTAEEQKLIEDATDGLFATPAFQTEQKSIDFDRQDKFFKVADMMIAKGIVTPQAAADFMKGAIGMQMLPYAQSLWDLMASTKPELYGTHDWDRLFAGTAGKGTGPSKGKLPKKGRNVEITHKHEGTVIGRVVSIDDDKMVVLNLEVPLTDPKSQLTLDNADVVGRWKPWQAKTEEEKEKAKALVKEFLAEFDKSKIKDFGEKIGGARKDTWRKSGLGSSDLDDMTDIERAAYTTRDNVWPTNWAQLIADGMPPGIAWLVKEARGAISKAPVLRANTDTLTQLRLYIDTIAKLRDALAKVRVVSDINDVWKAVFPNDIDRSFTLVSRSKPNSILRTKIYNVDNWDLTQAENKVKSTGWPTPQKLWQLRFDIELVPAGTEEWTQVSSPQGGTEGKYVKTEKDKWTVTYKGRSKALESFPTKEAAEEWATSKLPGGGQSRLTRPYVKEAVRIGPDYRGGKDVTGEDLLKTFGFRGGEFGNWTNQADRQNSLNQAFDGLKDLARVLGLPDKALSINGQLGIGFGSRGKGGKGAAAAHYEPVRVVINLTKGQGSGSLAHEWGHAVDDYFGKLAGKPAGEMASEGIRAYQKGDIRTEMKDAWSEVVQSMVGRLQDQQVLIDEAQKDVDSQTREIDKLLADLGEAFAKQPPEKEEQFLHLSAMLRADIPRELPGNPNASEETLANALHELATTINKPLTKDQRSDINRNAYWMSRYRKKLDGAIAGEITRSETTNFYKKALARENGNYKGYYARMHEMFARAFESYVQRKLGAEKIGDAPAQSDYLVHSARGDDTEWGQMYPTEPDSTAIDKAFVAFWNTLKTEKTDKGTIRLYATSSSPQMVPLPIRVFHGTHAEVEKFSLSKIGTGEGAQVFGWGLYFAGHKDVGKFYANPRLDPTATPEEKALVLMKMWGTHAPQMAADQLRMVKRDLEHVRWKPGAPRSSYTPGMEAVLEAHVEFAEKVNAIFQLPEEQRPVFKKGRLYEVDLHVNIDQLLDWDLPMSQQSEKVRDALREAGHGDKWQSFGGLKERYRDQSGGRLQFADKLSAQELYRGMSYHLGSPRAASEHLKSIGILGIRYLDARSRAGTTALTRGLLKRALAENTTYNYVIFDESAISTPTLLLHATPSGDVQLGIPAGKRDKFMALARALYAEGVKTPKALSDWMESRYGDKARPYYQQLWNLLAVVDNTLRGIHDWVKVREVTAEPEPKPETKSFAVEIQTAGDADDVYKGNGLRFPSRESAETYAQDLMSRFMSATKYRIVESPEEPNLDANGNSLTTPPPPKETPTQQIANYVQSRLVSGEPFNSFQLFEVADKAYGGTQAEAKYTSRDAYDAMELGVNRWIIARQIKPEGTIDEAKASAARLVEQVLKVIPSQTKRTPEQDEFQQFSTPPPLAFVAAWAADISPDDAVVDTSAGIGGLAVFAKNAGAEVHVNELSDRRSAILATLFDNVTEVDGAIWNALKPNLGPTVGLINPPFSATGGRVDYKDTKHGAQHLESLLQNLQHGGRLVAITGEGMAADRPAFKDWWAKIAEKYNVRANIGVDGDLYRKYGTTFDNQLIVIDKPLAGKKPEPYAPVTGKVTSYDDLIDLIAPIRAIRVAAGSPQTAPEPTGGGDTQGGGGDTTTAPEPSLPPPDVVGPGPTTGGTVVLPPGGQGGSGGTSGGTLKPPKPGGGSTGVSGGKSGSTPEPTGPKEEPTGSGGDAPGNVDTGSVGGDVTKVEVTPAEQEASEVTDAVWVPWTTTLDIKGQKPHPTPLVESASMAAVRMPVATYEPKLNLDAILSGDLSDAQLLPVVYSGQSHDRMLPDGIFRYGYFVGDGTGVGKGRIIAAIMQDNRARGRKKGIWISEKKELIKAARGDVRAVGDSGINVIDFSKTQSKTGTIKEKEGVLFLSYDTLAGDSEINEFPPEYRVGAIVRVIAEHKNGTVTKTRTIKGDTVMTVKFDDGFIKQGLKVHEVQSIKVAPGGLKSRMDQVVEWFGVDYDGPIMFDEAHNAANALTTTTERGDKGASQKAMAVVELQRRLPNARIVYVSATGATEVQNLAYADRLGIWGPGAFFTDKKEFISKIGSAGLSAMEIIARDLKTLGLMNARTLSFGPVNPDDPKDNGVEFNVLEHPLTPEQKVIYDKLARTWQLVWSNMRSALQSSNGDKNAKQKADCRKAYFKRCQDFFNQVLTAMGMPSVIAQMHQRLKPVEEGGDAGAILIQIVNTNEATQERGLKKILAEEGDIEDLDTTPKDILAEFVKKSFPTELFQKVTDPDGNETWVLVTDPVTGEAVHDPESIRLRDELIDEIKDLAVPDNPLEQILAEFGHDNVAEITGRGRRTVWVEKDGKRVREVEKRTDKKLASEAEDFVNDKRRILIFSSKGGTGFSYHSGKDFKNQRRRFHFLIQAGWRADKAIQGLGRGHRSGEVNAPYILLVRTDLAAHKRFISTIARRLSQLGAMTAGERRSTGQGLFNEDDNLEHSYAQAALDQLISESYASSSGRAGGRIADAIPWSVFTDQMGFDNLVHPKKLELIDSRIPPVPRFLNRLLALEFEQGNALFNKFYELLQNNIEQAKIHGLYDPGLQTLSIEAGGKIEKLADESVYQHPSGGETRLVEVEITEPAKYLSWTDLFERYKQEPQKVVENKRTGTLYAIYPGGTHTDPKTGRVVQQVRKVNISRPAFVPASEVETPPSRPIIEGANPVYEDDEVTFPEGISVIPQFTNTHGTFGPLYAGDTIHFDPNSPEPHTAEIKEGTVVIPRQALIVKVTPGPREPVTITVKNVDWNSTLQQYVMVAKGDKKYPVTPTMVVEPGPRTQGNFADVPLGKAPELWAQQIAEAPIWHKEKKTFLVGLFLPIWNKLTMIVPRVFQFKAGGERMIGILVPPRMVGPVRKALGVGMRVQPPADVHRAIKELGSSYVLSNSWILRRVKIANEHRIELKGPGTFQLDELTGMGLFAERIGFKQRFFIPVTKEGIAALARVLDKWPITSEGESTSGLAATPIGDFLDEDVKPILKGSKMGVTEVLQAIVRTISPTTGVDSAVVDQLFKNLLGDRNQNAYMIDRLLMGFQKMFDKLPRQEAINFIDSYKAGEIQPTPELIAVDALMRQLDEASWAAAVNAYKELGIPEDKIPLAWKENHYRVMWKVVPGHEGKKGKGMTKRPLRGSRGMQRMSTLDSMSEGIKLDGEPYSWNPVVNFKQAQADIWKLTSALRVWKWAKDSNLVKFVKGRHPALPDGMAWVDDNITRVYFRAESGEGLIEPGRYAVDEGMARLLNNYLSSDKIRRTSIGRGLLWIKNFTTSIELSLSPFHAVFETLEMVGSTIGHGLTKLANRGVRSALHGDFGPAASAIHDMTLGAIASPVSGFLMGREIRKAAADPDAYFQTPAGKKMEKNYPGSQMAIHALWEAGWKPTELEQDWKNNSIRTFIEALSDIKANRSNNYIGAGLRAFPAANEMLMKPLFDVYIPSLKVAQFVKEFIEAKQQDNLKYGASGHYVDRRGKRWERPTDAERARTIWRFVEDRFGELNYDTLFWNNNFKTAMQLMFRSVTWKLGSLEAMGGAFAGQAKEFINAARERRAPELHRNMAWLFGMFLLTATLGAIISMTLARKKPQSLKDFVFPQIDPKDDKLRVSLPTYWKDMVHLIHSPVSYITASMSGWIGRVADLLRNKDYYGVQIRDTDDPIVKQALAVGKYTGETLLPFSIRGYKNLSDQEVGSLRKALAFVAINPAPRHIGQSNAEKKAEEYWKGRATDAGISPEQFEAKAEKRRIVQQIRHGKAPDISRALASGTLRPKDVKSIYQRAQMGALPSQVLHMPLEDAEKVYQRATPAEKVKLAPIMAKKRINSYKRSNKPFTGFGAR